ncbi:MAG TPA: 2Fe-2S iron-sulfur cluster-binding protein, partial [Thiolinea sp.]|nr:2Fe-2S iron-sulfur cluster-binding protein [Thiolinea sp.]
MPFRVQVSNTGQQFQVAAGETVLQAALRQGVSLPWGCAAGVCGSCLGRVLEGRMVYPHGPPLALFEPDRARGLGLFCVGCPVTDLVIHVPE